MNVPTSRPPELLLRRVLMRHVGPGAARFDPLVLDLTVPPGLAASKVLWSLTNTGGKTTLLRLLTSVVVPNAREQMGKANIGEFVQTGDTAHVVAEWESAIAGRFVVACCYEWPGRSRPRDVATGSLNRLFYTFRTPDGFDITDLPFLSDNHRRTLDDYRAALTELFRTQSTARFVWTRTQSEWRKILDEQTELDPELFRYQMRMNDDESGADRLVSKLNSADAVVEFFVSALNDRAVSTEFTTTLGKYATAAANRANLELDAEFSDRISSHLAGLAEAADYARLADGDVATRASASGELVAEIAARADREEAVRDAAKARQQEAEGKAGAISGEINRLTDIRSQLMLEEAHFRHAAALAAEAQARADRSEAEHEYQVCQALGPVARWRAAQAAVHAARDAYDIAEQDLKPLRDRVRMTGASLAAKYMSLITAAETDATNADELAEDAKSRRKAAGQARTGHIEARTAATSELRRIDQVVAEARKALEELHASGDAAPDETAQGAETRWNGVVIETEAAERTASARIAALGAQINDLRTRLNHTSKRLGEAESSLQRASDDRDRYRSELAELTKLDDITAVVGRDEPDMATLLRTAGILDTRAQSAEQSAASADSDLRAAQRELDVLEQSELLSTSPEVERVRDHLISAGIGATTGWSWIAANIADVERRRQLIAEHPEIANGVIVTDATRIAEAAKSLGTIEFNLRIAVLVTSAPGSEDLPDGTAGFVVEPHRAVYDPEWAINTAEELRAQISTMSINAADHRATAERIRSAVAELAGFRRRWEAKEPTVEANVATAQSAVDDFTGRRDVLATELAGLEEDQNDHREALPQLQAKIRAAEKAAAHCNSCAQLATNAAAARDTRPAVEHELNIANRGILDADATIEQADTDRETALAKAATARESAGRWRDRLPTAGVEPGDGVPDTPVEELERKLEALRFALSEKEKGSEHATRLTFAESHAVEMRTEVGRHDPAVVEEAEARRQDNQAATPEGRAELLRVAEANRSQRIAAHLEASETLKQAAKLVSERRPQDRTRTVHAQLTEDWTPHDVEECTALAGRAEQLNIGHRNRFRDMTAAAEAATRAVEAAERNRWSFSNTVNLWDKGPVPTGAVFEGTPDEAQAALNDRIAAWRAAQDERESAVRDRTERRDEVRSCAVDERWSSFPLAEKCRRVPDDELFERAAAWAKDLQIRLRNIRDELTELNRHRDSLVTQLHALAEAQLRLMRAVTNSSKIPSGFGEMSGMPAFRIEFDKLDQTEAAAKLAGRVDAWAAQLGTDPRRATRTDQIDRWLAEAAKDLVKVNAGGTAWRVKVLKPLLDGRTYYCSPDRIEREYSGGQELTLAVLLYCCLAAVRSSHRTGGRRPPGALLLDNPFGKASNPQLIAMQQALARKSGIQLICATGINDPTIVAAFEGSDARVLKLRNDVDQRRGLHHLRIADPVIAEAVNRAVLNGHAPDDPNGYVSAVGYTIADTEPGPEPA